MGNILTPLISGLAALIGVIVGGALSYSLEMKRWRREDARRFDLERRQAYSKFLRIVNQLNFLDGERIPEGLQTEFANALTEIEIVATPAVYKRVYEFAQIVNDQLINRNPSTLPANAWYRGRTNLIEIIRKEMGIESPYAMLHSDD
jgi:phenylalanine-4-hydroxylase